MALPPIVALEIGTSKVIALVAEMREDDHVMITGMGEHPSTGVRKGEIIDLENAVVGVRSVLEMAEESGNVAIRQVHLAVSGGHIAGQVNRGAVPVLDKDGEITEDDMDQVMDLAKAVNLAPDREILHTVCQHFQIDDHTRVVNPEGMVGAKLALDTLILHGIRTRLHNTIRVVKSIPVDVQDVAFSGLCSGLAVLSSDQKKIGVLVVDIGGGTTDYVVYTDGIVATAGVLAVGGDHITNDITQAFNVPMSRGEQLKVNSGSAVISVPVSNPYVSLPAEAGFPGSTVNVRALHTVINARVDEILSTIRKRVDEQGLLRHLGAGVVLTGGTAHLRGIADLGRQVFGLPVTVGKPRNVSGLATATEGPEYASCSGLAQYGFMTMAEQKRSSSWGRWLRGLFGG